MKMYSFMVLLTFASIPENFVCNSQGIVNVKISLIASAPITPQRQVNLNNILIKTITMLGSAKY